MASTSTAAARNLLKNCKSLPQALRGQILGRSNVSVNISNMAKDQQMVQSFFVSNQNVHAQLPIFYFREMGSLLGPSGGLSLVERVDGRGMRGVAVKARGKRGVEEKDDDEVDDVIVDDDDDDDDDYYNEDDVPKYRKDSVYDDDPADMSDDEFYANWNERNR